MQSGNPTLNQNTFLDVGSGRVLSGEGAMTMNGTVNKTAFLLILALVGAMFSWSRYAGPESIPGLMPLAIGGAVVGLVLALVTVFKKTWAPITAPLYAAIQGVFIGAISVIFEARFPGIVMQAVGLTFGVMAAMLMAYRSGLIRATEKFKLGVVAATGGVLLLYLANFVMGFFGHSIGIVTSNSAMGIGFSLVVVVIAALNLILDFDLIESGVAQGAPRYMEWYGAFALVVTLVWLYLEMLRLLSKVQSRN
ncbi:Bax inhibitor-1/YccA family membrane protein [Dokdonella sp.]|uniref:Bax inhibitor-1/YccA family protein n=1 Tax=Dokdonella sp. TaxID=2291710 RepID=UPI0031BD6FF9|nr:Bax inhibitor-1/YccA family protein [Dokdonella sp.]